MKIGATYGIGFDPYKDYTAALRRSVDIKSNMPASIGEQFKPGDNTASTRKAQGAEETASDSGYKVPALDMKSVISEEVASLEAEAPARNDERVEKIAESLKGLQDFELIGRDSSIDKLDTMQALSGMKKDSILQEYQYFVGNLDTQNDAAAAGEDGIFFAKKIF